MAYEELLNDPVILAVGGAILLGAFLYKQRQEKSNLVDINPESMAERLHSIFVTPTRKQGSPINDYVKIRGTSNTPKTLGMAIRAKDHEVKQVELKDPDKEDSKLELKEDVDGTTYGIVEGSKWYKVKPKYFLYKLTPGSMLYDTLTETYDVPHNHIIPGDDYIWFSHKTHFVKFNGVNRVLSPAGMGRVWDLSFAKTHENYLETEQNIPEQYATLNNRISGQLKMENIKSENIRKYVESKDKRDKKDAMTD